MATSMSFAPSRKLLRVAMPLAMGNLRPSCQLHAPHSCLSTYSEEASPAAKKLLEDFLEEFCWSICRLQFVYGINYKSKLNTEPAGDIHLSVRESMVNCAGLDRNSERCRLPKECRRKVPFATGKGSKPVPLADMLMQCQTKGSVAWLHHQLCHRLAHHVESTLREKTLPLVSLVFASSARYQRKDPALKTALALEHLEKGKAKSGQALANASTALGKPMELSDNDQHLEARRYFSATRSHAQDSTSTQFALAPDVPMLPGKRDPCALSWTSILARAAGCRKLLPNWGLEPCFFIF